jgi:hypothetical protein
MALRSALTSSHPAAADATRQLTGWRLVAGAVLLFAMVEQTSTVAQDEGPVSAATTTAGVSNDDQSVAVYAAATSLLNVLTESQRAAVQFEFKDEEQRQRWSNLPTGIFERKGLRMGDLTPAQREAVMNVLRATLSANGFAQIEENMEAEETLNTGGGRLKFGRDEFYFSLLGQPSLTEPWMWQFGGHHLALNATVIDQRITLAPSLTGGQPMSFTRDGQPVDQMNEEVAAAFELVNALDETQRSKAVIAGRFGDMQWGPGRDDARMEPRGIRGSELNESQRTLLRRILAERVGLLNDEDTAERMAEIDAGLPDTWFAWSGPNASGSSASYAVHGPSVFLEFAPQQMGGQPMNHVHAMYREPGNDYGLKWFRER